MKESEVGYALTLNGFVQCEPQLKGIAMDGGESIRVCFETCSSMQYFLQCNLFKKGTSRPKQTTIVILYTLFYKM